jgi:hypothetical protein
MVVLRGDDAVGFLADSCGVLADAVNEVRVSRTTDPDLVEVYAELVVAYSRLVRRRLDADPGSTVRVNILGHLEERIRQATAGEIAWPVLDVVDRLHGELTREPAVV